MNSEHDFDVYIQYADAMGNIGGITRQGLIGNDSDDEPVYGLMDGLSYTYTSGVLTKVTESGNQDFGYLGAESGFMYDHGKLVSAAGRGILSIRYNKLNLPAQITTPEGVIDILYDAEGVKWYQRTKWDENPPASYPGGEEVKVYTNGLELINGAPAALYNSHGRAVLNADGSLQQHEFFLSDHLGNTRVVFADLNGDGELDFSAGTAEVLQTNSYYPFGMPIEGMTPMDATDPAQHYLYNGKERSLLAGLYDYGARWYDPSIGRWGVVDPLADEFAAWSSYNYTINNPIRFIDPDGRSPSSPNYEYRIVIENGKSTTVYVGDKGGDEKDYVTVVNYDRAPYEDGVYSYETSVNIEYTSGPGRNPIDDPTPGEREYHGKNYTDIKAYTILLGGGAIKLLKSLLNSPQPKYKEGSAGGPGAGKRFTSITKDAAEQQAGGDCVFCGVKTDRVPGSPNQRNTDHAIPKSRGGNNTLENAQNTCVTCNQDKGTQTTKEYLNKK